MAVSLSANKEMRGKVRYGKRKVEQEEKKEDEMKLFNCIY